MSADPSTLDTIAERFLEAETSRQPIAPISSEFDGLSVEDCYAAQDVYVAKKVSAGGKVAGFKVGATGAESQARFGVDEPVYGHTFGAGRTVSGRSIDCATLIDPKIECEIGLRLGRDLDGPGVTLESALDAIDGVLGMFEIVDARTQNWKVGFPEMICDNGVQAGYVTGMVRPFNKDIDLGNIDCTFLHNGEVKVEANSSVVMDNPVNSLVWLANKLAKTGQGIAAGAIIISGSMTGLTPIKAGDTFEARFSELEPISIRFE
ncbi:MAG: fumarylacetoacetate hydrolase family protein [Rhodospirillaceae bacterium]|jgi:2-keto-4-pentenoate hydratase